MQQSPHPTTLTAHQLDQDQDLLTELRILSSLRPQDRISTNHAVKPVVRIQKPEFLRSVYRFFGSESRTANVAYIQSLLQRVIDRHSSAQYLKDSALGKRIRDETQQAILGIRRLQKTYQDDAQFQASVNVSVDTVCIHLGITPLELHPMTTPPPRKPIRPALPSLNDEKPPQRQATPKVPAVKSAFLMTPAGIEALQQHDGSNRSTNQPAAQLPPLRTGTVGATTASQSVFTALHHLNPFEHRAQTTATADDDVDGEINAHAEDNNVKDSARDDTDDDDDDEQTF